MPQRSVRCRGRACCLRRSCYRGRRARGGTRESLNLNDNEMSLDRSGQAASRAAWEARSSSGSGLVGEEMSEINK
jgi:hypothetical protein